MRFRQQQDDARSTTHGLLALFAVLLLALVLAVNGLLWGLWWGLGWLLGWDLSAHLPDFFVETNTAVVLLFVLGGALVELGRLREGGGSHVAEWAGGRLLTDPRDLFERRLLNVVDEMALASGLPRPAVYVLEREDAINAFAAGWLPESSAVAVTRGALDRLTRDELQGLVAHEFGHIHQGDLRLNMQLLALVWGLSLVHGYGLSLLEANEAGRRSALGLIVGPVFVAAGLLGWLAGQLLQAAVSRQRELLADACAVQFTRSRDGLGGVLRKVWHQSIKREDRLNRVPARLLAGMLLQAPADWLRTHPPLRDRLQRIYGRSVDPQPAPMLAANSQADEAYQSAVAPMMSVMAPAIAYAVAMPDPSDPAAADAPSPVPRAIADEAEREATDRLSRLNGPGELRATILAMLLTPDSQRERRAWREETKGLSTANALRHEVKKLGPAVRLPWLEALLKRMSNASLLDRQTLMEAARRVMSADGQVRPIDRLHWLLLRQRLGEAQAVKPATDAHNDMAQLSLHMRRQIALVTAYLARLVPGGNTDNGHTWYRAVMQPWLKGEALPDCVPPDADGLVSALQDVQSLPWMLKPVLVRAWLDAALQQKGAGALDPNAADALRLASGLLDSPLPPELARHYVEPAST